jgi:hypothetical protein
MDLLHELNWYTLRIGWRVIVREQQGSRVRLVWEYKKTREVRQEYVRA